LRVCVQDTSVANWCQQNQKLANEQLTLV
jgi:hypothetical protein